MLKIRHSFAVLSACLLLSVAAVAQLTSAEESIVRTTYAKLNLASQVGSVHMAISARSSEDELRALLGTHTLNYKINSLSGGDLLASGQQRYIDLVTRPEGQVVLSGQGTEPYMDGETSVSDIFATADWGTGQTFADDWSKITLQKALFLSGNTQYTRYASVNVTLTLGKGARTYNSLFLFSPRGETFVADFVTGISVASWIVNKPVYPRTLLDTRLRLEPAVMQWLSTTQIANASCASGKSSECCDNAALRCGITPSDAANSFEVQARRPELAPIVGKARAEAARIERSAARERSSSAPPEKMLPADDTSCSSLSYTAPGNSEVDSDASKHWNGNHSWYAEEVGSCTYSDPPPGSSYCTALASTRDIPNDGRLWIAE